MHQILFRLGLCPRPAEGAYSAPSDPLAEFNGPTSKGREERGGKGKGVEGKEGKGRRGNVAFHHLLLSNLTTGVMAVQGHPKSLVLVPVELKALDFLLVISRNLGPILHCFADIAPHHSAENLWMFALD